MLLLSFLKESFLFSDPRFEKCPVFVISPLFSTHALQQLFGHLAQPASFRTTVARPGLPVNGTGQSHVDCRRHGPRRRNGGPISATLLVAPTLCYDHWQNRRRRNVLAVTTTTFSRVGNVRSVCWVSKVHAAVTRRCGGGRSGHVGGERRDFNRMGQKARVGKRERERRR
jgi:hypothetical protein